MLRADISLKSLLGGGTAYGSPEVPGGHQGPPRDPLWAPASRRDGEALLGGDSPPGQLPGVGRGSLPVTCPIPWDVSPGLWRASAAGWF